jgi:hypothetical protein
VLFGVADARPGDAMIHGREFDRSRAGLLGISIISAAFCTLASGATWAGPLTGPVLDAGQVVVVEDVIQLPFSSGSRPHARLNVLQLAPDGSGRIFVSDLNGPFYVIDGATVSTYLDFGLLFANLKTSPGLASGFVSFALHPEFASNGLFYTVHTEFVGSTPANLGPTLPVSVIQHSILTEWEAIVPALNVFAGSSRELIRIASPHNHHNLGEISFDPSLGIGDDDYGLLYLAAGDFGSVESSQPEQLQRLDTPYGAMLRIDPLGGPFTRGTTTYDYGIPPGNPFAGDGDPDTLGEIYTYGFRNGHRIVWDTIHSGAAFVTDIGERNIEEIAVLASGANYGWPEREGTYAIDVTASLGNVFALPLDDASYGYSYPAAQYDHDDVSTFSSAIAGAAVYRGSPAHALYGEFIFGDIVAGDLFHSSVGDLIVADDGVPATTAQIYSLGVLRNGTASSIADIVADALGIPSVARTDLRIARVATGEIYITTKQDAYVRKLLPIEVAYPNGWSLVGSAVGGYPIDFSIAGVALQITTTAGQTAEEVAQAMTDAIQLDATLQSLGFYGYRLGARTLTNGSADSLVIGDPGIALAPGASVPAMQGWALAGLVLALIGISTRFRRKLL